jgi:hypothetical protein
LQKQLEGLMSLSEGRQTFILINKNRTKTLNEFLKRWYTFLIRKSMYFILNLENKTNQMDPEKVQRLYVLFRTRNGGHN